jgi:dihydroorotate dehydrogenase (fumarate)
MKLHNPVIVGSSGMTGTVSGVKQAEAGGAGAVILKSPEA